MSALQSVVTQAPAVLRVDEPAPGVLRVLINRPDKRNAIDYDVRAAMLTVLGDALASDACRALVLGGVEQVFSAGGDVHSMGQLDEAGARERMQHIHVLCRLLATAPVPVVTAMEGIAAGASIGMALLGDVIVVGERTRILFPFLKLGLTPDWGMLLTLPRRVGVGRARRMFSAGDLISGPAAFEAGLADVLVADDVVMATAVAQAEALAALPREAFARMKARLNSVSMTLDDELAREEDDQAQCLLGAEFTEGLSAFLEKRAPNFRGAGEP
ncbi:enoyl-CoA hydratase [Alcanivorax sp. S71-1-4]|uniref:enoyl-CoA hydratase/isomerase family protein n=1 Tax=Alcanivorax sp. S71-1-4 TaxID=1177159 RepID=UPI001358D300|nr:enoyl-CoA hydratase-related protein [Alcanivorax sp. S71-1-4]KAF0809979.1 enoyl-CoA hydratase [Alcanivorax sp. S71-1-4]